MLTPSELRTALPISDTALATVVRAQDTIRQILAGEDPRLLAIVGPCSIHDPVSALEYAGRLARLAGDVNHSLVLVMRTYFEKPRTTVGWRGLITDPDLDGTCDMDRGLMTARRLLLDINSLGLACATESLDPMLVGYTEDLVAWTALGARTAESQVHRAMASGLPMPVGIKNGTDGAVETAADALVAAAAPQVYPALDHTGRITVRRSPGNPWGHLVLRGGRHGPNFSRDAVQAAENVLTDRGLSPRLVVDCSHANSAKRPERQLTVLDTVADQICSGNRSIRGLMIESHLEPGNQAPDGELRHGVSITDPCLGWSQTEEALRQLATRLGDGVAGCGDDRERAA